MHAYNTRWYLLPHDKLSRSVPVCVFSNFPSTMMRHQFRYKIIFLKHFKVTIDNICILCHKDMQYFLVTCIERVSHSCESDTYLLFKIYNINNEPS